MSQTASFWARRKAGVEAETQAEQAALDAQALAQDHAALEDKSDAEILAELELPDPDTMKMGDDFSAFMSKAVPDQIRRRALRTLWRSNPVLANVDMLVDYGEDFTDSALVVENMQTAYQVGKGMLKHVQEMARQAEERENPPEVLAEEPDEDLPEDVEVASEDIAVAPLPEEPQNTEETEVAFAAPAPRRMKFSIEGTTA